MILLLVNQFNNATPEHSDDPEKTSSSKYYDIEEINNIEIPLKNKSLSLFHINTCSISKNFDNLQHSWIAPGPSTSLQLHQNKVWHIRNKWNKNYKTSTFII